MENGNRSSLVNGVTENGVGREKPHVAVENLIDFDDDDDGGQTPSYLSPTVSVRMFNQSGSSTLDENSFREDFYEGVANGALNGSSLVAQTCSLIDSPIRASSPLPGGAKRLTTNALASQLYYGRAGGSSTRSGSRRSSFNSDVESMSASDPGLGAGAIVVSTAELSELKMQMDKMQQQMDNRIQNEDTNIRLKQENAVLLNRVNTLEEQLMIVEDRWRQKLADEERKNREIINRAEREKVLEVDTCVLRQQLLEREHSQCTLERQKLLGDMDQLRKKCDRLEQTVADLKDELGMVKDEHEVAEQRLWKQKEDAEKRLRLALETGDELRREAEQLRGERGYADGTASELEEELLRLKEEQKRLRQTNDDLHAELLQASVEHGRKLLSDGPSLAEEMDQMSKDQIMVALRDQEIVNQKLRSYVDGILLRIMEMYPAILEIKSE